MCPGAGFNCEHDCTDAELIGVYPGVAFNSGLDCADAELIGMCPVAAFNFCLVLVDHNDAVL